ncbi:uncharacterized protein LOC106426163 [Brassica napus]|uniref:uncharacterized protein LOC106426163 n=1 Tax=Brassica napus TaxID=3708 RepID=UPI00207A25AB|nr:uncharacterized protein LOC106426163 [Brassica napus]
MEVEKALVLWNISSCPIPDGHDPLMVVQRIQAAVEKSGYVRRNGEISITAIGNKLTEVPGEDVMRRLSSIGIALKNADEYQMDLYNWADENPPPGTMMVIDGQEQLGWLAGTLSELEDKGFRILLAYPHRDLAATPFPCKQWDWAALFSDEQETTTATTTSLIGGSPWFCEVCFVAAPSLEDFTTHLKSVKHAYGEWDRHASKNNVDRTNPANLPFGRSNELDLLLNQDMLRRQMLTSGRGRGRRRGPLGPLRPQHTFNLTHSKY